MLGVIAEQIIVICCTDRHKSFCLIVCNLSVRHKHGVMSLAAIAVAVKLN